MRLTTRTDLAMRTLMFCAVNPGVTVRKADIATACNASANHLGLVINMLSQGGFVETMRGRNGGLQLSRAPDAISVGAVFRYLESDVPFAECFAPDGGSCPLAECCRLGDALCKALDAFYQTLDGVSVADLTRGNTELHRTLAVTPLAA